MSAKENEVLLQKAAEIIKFQRHMELTLAPLKADIKFAYAQLLIDKTNEQFWRRTLIRCILARIEALLWNMKHGIPIIAPISGVQLTAADKENIREERTKIINGNPEIRPSRLKFRDNVKMTFSLFGKVHKINFAVNCDKDFDALCNTYDLRSRLMHPKKPMDPEVSDSAINDTKQGLKWLKEEYDRLMKECGMPQMAKGK